MPALVDLVEIDEVALGAPPIFRHLTPETSREQDLSLPRYIHVDTEFVNTDVGRLFYACGMDGVFQGPLGWRRAAVVFSTRPETR